MLHLTTSATRTRCGGVGGHVTSHNPCNACTVWRRRRSCYIPQPLQSLHGVAVSAVMLHHNLCNAYTVWRCRRSCCHTKADKKQHVKLLFFWTRYSVDGRNVASDSACGRDELNTDARLFQHELPPHPPSFNVDWQHIFHPRSTPRTTTSTLKLGVKGGRHVILKHVRLTSPRAGLATF